MRKTSKLLISLAPTVAMLLPLAAISCTNYKKQLEEEIKVAKEKSKNINFVENNKNSYLSELEKAEKVLKNEKSTKEELKKAYEDFTKNVKEILVKNKKVLEIYSSNETKIISKFNELKAFAAEKLSETKYNELKKQMVNDYNQFKEEISKVKTFEYTNEKTIELEKKAKEILKKYETGRSKIDNKE